MLYGMIQWSLILSVTHGVSALTLMTASSTKPKLLQPFGKPSSNHHNRNIVCSKGVRVWDDKGNEYIDGIGSLWYCQVGYGREEIIEAVTDQLKTLMYNQFPPFECSVAEECAARIVGLSSNPDGRAYLCTSGSEAVDTAIKLVRAVAQLKGEPDRQIIVHRQRGYHGVNIGGTSAQGIISNREGWGDLMPHFFEIEADSIEAVEAIFSEHGDKILAVITEPVQAAGGVFLPPEGYLEGLRELCTRNGSLLIFDEVITGFGRTGSWFASQTYGVEPDLMTFAKGATSGYQPLGGVVLSRAVCNVLEADPEYLLRHGHTYSGHTGAAAACLANIDLIERERLVDRANHIGIRLSSGLKKLVVNGDIREVRGVGALWAARLNNDDTETTTKIRDHMLDLGVIVRPLYDSIAFCPPLVMDDADIDHMIYVLAQAIREVHEKQLFL